MKKICKDCNKEFILTEGEINFYNSKNLDLPKRCSECREKNKHNNEKTTQPTSSKKTGKNSLIAVVIMIIGALLFGDNLLPEESNSTIKNNPSIENNTTSYSFKDSSTLDSHFEKHKDEFGYTSIDDYVNGANVVINSEDSLHKTEAEDGDSIFYLEESNEIVFISSDGYIRTYFKPTDGIDYFNRQ
ncbi:MAG: zinc-ribbon domain containing protein [Lachnospirales bacterium]